MVQIPDDIAFAPGPTDDLRAQLDQTMAALVAARQALAVALDAQHALLGGTDPCADLRAEVHRLQTAITELEASEAYRVGRAVTWPARHLKRLLLRRR